MRGDQPVVLAASWIVRASISRQGSKTLTRSCQGWRRAGPRAGGSARPGLGAARRELPSLGDLALALGAACVVHRLLGQHAALSGAGETSDGVQEWHAFSDTQA